MTASPLNVAWKKKLRGRLDATRLNSELLPEYKAINKADPERTDVWLMVVEQADKAGFEFNHTDLEFVAKRQRPGGGRV